MVFKKSVRVISDGNFKCLSVAFYLGISGQKFVAYVWVKSQE